MVEFNHQNVLSRAYFDEEREGIKVTLDGIIGADLIFPCLSVIVENA
jgi:hypothetical protein